MATSSKTTSTKFEKVGEVRGMSDDRDFHAGSKKDRLEDLVNVRDKVGDNRKPHKSGNGADGKKSTFDFLSPTTLTILSSKVVKTRGRMDRGKSKSIYKVKLKSCWFPICNKGVRIGNKKIQNAVLTSSSSGSELGFGAGPLLYKGECSKVTEVQGPTNQVYIGPISTLNNSPGAKRKYRADEVDDRANLNSEQIQQVAQTQGEDSREENESFVEETQMIERGSMSKSIEKEQGINLCIDLRSQESKEVPSGNVSSRETGSSASEVEISKCITRRKKLGREADFKKGRGIDSGVKSHPMKTRRAKLIHSNTVSNHKRLRKVSWNLEEEMTKVIEKGTELGVNFKSRWFMPLNILLTFIIGSALGWILVKITRTPRDLWGLIIGCCAAGNQGNLPLIIIPAVCKERGGPFGNADVCYNQGIAYSSLSMAISSIYMWVYVYNLVRIFSSKNSAVVIKADDIDSTIRPENVPRPLLPLNIGCSPKDISEGNPKVR
ncbi:hypothetical protein LWI29_000134 [Acer saccharum]|uniref:Uncharacterized protein n=1 Tax=Acer saccharum TaxID=4024 RepID=A0AA39W3Z0_ACESA|nr:hypothetical protein LWI29_000134 [Acer saccharum]